MMYLNENNVFLGNNNVAAQIKGFDVDIAHWCSVNKSYNEYGIIYGRWIDKVGATFFVVPRAVMSRASYSVVLDNFNDTVMLIDFRDNNDNECNDCPYSENCNGHVFFRRGVKNGK